MIAEAQRASFDAMTRPSWWSATHRPSLTGPKSYLEGSRSSETRSPPGLTASGVFRASAGHFQGIWRVSAGSVKCEAIIGVGTSPTESLSTWFHLIAHSDCPR
jgi:hypothetical protein